MTDALPPDVRPVAEIREMGNRLLHEPSLYLRQHAHNPIEWYPWGEEAMTRAREADLPIFLSVGYSSCHWCHVMEHEVFEHDDVAEFMNRHFVCIKVDREERPDLDAAYMDAVHLLTGRGGWPMSVFLTPEGRPFFGGTYFPKDAFLQLTGQIATAWREQPQELRQQADRVAARVSSPPDWITNARSTPLQENLLTSAVGRAAEVYDETYGGFQQRQKFPTPVKWRFLLHEYRRSRDEDLRRMIATTLEAMQGGGIRDHVGGGFHRYTVDTDWTVPHFEKMLYDNGQLAGLFLEAGVALERRDFTATGLDVLDFLLREMRDPAGGFYASFDADSGGEEGTYYVWSPADLTAVVGEGDGPALVQMLGVTETGNFEHTGKSVLTRRADVLKVAHAIDRAPVDLEALFDRHRVALRAVRDERTPPGLDRKVVTSWNGLTIAALAQAYAVTGRDEYLTAAERAADFLLTSHRRADGSLWRTTSEGQVSGEGVLDDYANLAEALLELYQTGGDARWLVAARDLVDFARREFVAPDGGFYLSRADDTPLGRTVEWFDSVVPSGNAVLLHAMLKLAALTGETVYHQEAKQILTARAGLLAGAGLETAWWLNAAGMLVRPFHDVVVAGAPDAADTQALRRAFLATLPPNAVLSTVPGAGPDPTLAVLAPALEGKRAVNGQALAYVCEFGLCREPVTDAGVMLRQLGLADE